MPPRRNPQRPRRGRPSSQPSNDAVDPNILAAVNQALSSMLPTIVAQTVDAVRQQPTGTHGQNPHGTPNNNAGSTGGGGGAAATGELHVWLERFQKQKPQSFTLALTPIEAENWISHIEKIFDVMGCSDNIKVKLAIYKLEGDAQRWWKVLKQAKGGDAYVETLTWAEFREVFYQRYFPDAEKDSYVREYANIRQRDDESITEFMTRFVRLAGFLGAAAGTSSEQAKKFKWAVNNRIRSRIINMNFSDVAEAADAAINVEMERLEYLASKQDDNRKRSRDGQRLPQSGQQTHGPKHDGGDHKGQVAQNKGNHQRPWRGRGQNQSQIGQGQSQGRTPGSGNQKGNVNFVSNPQCNFCGKRHPGNTCYRASGACFTCGQIGHQAKDCKNGGNKAQPTTGGRVFALTANEATGAPDGGKGNQSLGR